MMTCFGYLKNKKQQQKKKKKPEEEKEKGAEASRRTALTSSAGSVTPCKSTASASPSRGIPDLYQEKAHNLRVFDLDELRNATNEFNRMLRIGQGGFGSVYKGFLQPPDEKGDRVAIAIKKLNPKGLQEIKLLNELVALRNDFLQPLVVSYTSWTGSTETQINQQISSRQSFTRGDAKNEAAHEYLFLPHESMNLSLVVGQITEVNQSFKADASKSTSNYFTNIARIKI